MPFVDRVHRVSLRIITMPIQSQGIIAGDNVSVDVAALAYYRVADESRSVVAIENEGEALAAGELARASDVMMAHPLALQLRNLQTLVEISVHKNSTVVFPAPLMSTIQELGAFLAREATAVDELPATPVVSPDIAGEPPGT